MKKSQEKAYKRKLRLESNIPKKCNINKTGDNFMDQCMETAEKLWDDLKKRIKENPDFVKTTDDDKLKIYQNNEFKDFYTSYPIVCRYAICMGQYSSKAFKSFLQKFKIMHEKTRASNKETKMDEWIKCQASYIKFLYQAYSRKSHSEREAQMVWQQAYNTLKQEFADFEKMHSEVEERLKKEEKYNRSEMVKEMTNRIANEEQSLSTNSTNHLVDRLKIQVMKQRWKNMVSQVKTDVEKIQPTSISRGKLNV
jgi:DNA segregation ATPase FtsK/SpoIIIE-like protein